MADYSRYKIEILKRMREKAYNRYYDLTTRQSAADNWGNGMRLAKLPQEKAWEMAKERYEMIEAEIRRRNGGKNEKGFNYNT